VSLGFQEVKGAQGIFLTQESLSEWETFHPLSSSRLSFCCSLYPENEEPDLDPGELLTKTTVRPHQKQFKPNSWVLVWTPVFFTNIPENSHLQVR
jgi:hypothetical protein